MARFQDQITDENLVPIAGAEILVFYASGPNTGQQAPLTNDGGAALTQPVQTDADGIFYYNTANGLYENHIYYGGELRYIQQAQVGPADPVSPDGIIALVCATRADLAAVPPSHGAAFLTEPGREGHFVIDLAANWTAKIAADTAQGLFVLSSVDATKVWRRVLGDHAEASWFGFIADDESGSGTNNAPALNAASAALKALTGKGKGVRLFIGGFGYVATKLTFDWPIHIIGNSGKGNTLTRLRWPAGQSGLFFDVGAFGWTAEHLTLMGGWNGGDEGEFHAIQWHPPGTKRDLTIYNWQGDAFYDVNSSGINTGFNSNGDDLERAYVYDCRRAYYCSGSDVNAKHISGLVCIQNRQAGIFEAGFLGNYYTAVLVETNGFYPGWTTGAANRPASYARFNGRVFAVVGKQEAWASTNAPPNAAANNQGWIYAGDAPTSTAAIGQPDWFSGITLRAGGGIIHQDPNNRSNFQFYSEGNQVNQFDLNVGSLTGFSAPSLNWMVDTQSGGVVGGWAPLNAGSIHYGSKSFHGYVNASHGILVPNTFWGNIYGTVDSRVFAAATDNLHQHYSSNYYNFTQYYSYRGTTTPTRDVALTAGPSWYAIDVVDTLYFRRGGANQVVIDLLEMYPGADNSFNLGHASYRYGVVFAASGTINTSDERHKREVKAIADKALDAWGEVDWVAYRDRDAVKAKGKAARVHTGLIAQRIEEAFARHKLDARKFGLLCFDQWDDRLEPKTETVTRTTTLETEHGPVEQQAEVPQIVLGEDGKPVMEVTRAAGEIFGIRYDEALAMEAAYQRRRADRIEARLTKLEARK